ncbi:MAG: prephenate dehydrogenase [Candidatus Euphemobacter frigidus]|nr:prephenate dehydrogenase [Candidatus Euphemobacter frigidus]MDP8276580.1 prephenate dehydrogenase [Candidatus Euphemobacter frigidus]
MYNKVTIIGVGLMGGSLGLVLKKKGLANEVMGWGRNEGRLGVALKRGALDRWTLDREEALANTDLLVFATPSGVTSRLAPKWFAEAPSGCLITDLLSVKGKVVETLTGLAGPRRYYASSHPLCGLERTGVAAARADLFDNRLCLITPVSATKKQAIGELQKLWQALGMRVISIAPARHDRVVAAVSHLPHLVAAALISQIGDEKLLRFSGTGLMDTTRVAGADPALWAEIISDNRKEVLVQIDGILETLMLVKQHIASKDPARIGNWLKKAHFRRRKLNDKIR